MVGEDWGQDEIDLAEYVRLHHISSLEYVDATGLRKMELDYLGVPATFVRCAKGKPRRDATVAIHAVTLLRSSACRRALAKRSPVFTVNDHIHVYAPEVSAPPER
jgi:hypothetical protein